MITLPFPHSASAARVLRRERPTPLQPCPFTRCFPRNLRERRVVGVGWRLLPVEPVPLPGTGPPVPRPPAHHLAPLSTQSQRRLGSEGTHGPTAESSAWLASQMPSAPLSPSSLQRRNGAQVSTEPLAPCLVHRPSATPPFPLRYGGAMRRHLKTLRLWFSSRVTAPWVHLAVSGDVAGGRDSGGCSLLLAAEASDADKYPSSHRAGPAKQDDPIDQRP